ncbi:MAG: ECF transporter S component [Clostridiales bacterium]|nr:ECF transporter S component [Clostridiales bacterium]
MQENSMQNPETTGVSTGQTVQRTQKITWKKRFSAKRLAFMAVFVALSFAVSLLDFPIFPATPFLKLDFGNVFILLISFLLGPIEGVIVCIVKESLRISVSTSGGIGELANMLTTCSYILLPSVVYHFRKGIKTVAWTLSVACIIGTAVALFANRYINFPLYMGEKAPMFFKQSFWFIVGFNLIKTVSIAVLTLLLYKRLSNFLKKFKI